MSVRRIWVGVLFAFLWGAPSVAQEKSVGDITSGIELARYRGQLDKTVWANEVSAQRYENTFVDLWDALIHTNDKFQVMRDFAFDHIQVPASLVSRDVDHGIVSATTGDTKATWSRGEFVDWLDDLEAKGVHIVETEWHHQEFVPEAENSPAKSVVSVVIHATRNKLNRRYVIRGKLQIEWRRSAPGEKKVAESIDATGLEILAREGQPTFSTALVENFKCDTLGRQAPTTIHPVVIRDLDRDGLPEVLAVGFNQVYWNNGDFDFTVKPLSQRPVANVNAAVLADFDGDSFDDLIVAAKNSSVFFIRGRQGGDFSSSEPQEVGLPESLKVPVSIAAGDVDGDGDLDLYLGQQKPGYQSGDIPTPYFDAVDSFPGYLLLNQGGGKFLDATEESGIGRKRYRRNFSSSLADLDEDGDLDLLLTSDFSGTDLLLNDGRGRFADASDQLRPGAYAFGMSHTFGDYNMDGRLDFITIGMSSTTARRLEKMGLGREDFPDHNAARMKMGYGNRLFLRTDDGFQQANFNQSCARTGWSWGSTTLDFDRDGDQDVYIVNGQTSGKTTKDYCTRFWCHDVYYEKGQRPKKAIEELFGNLAPLFSGEAISWNGYEHNALLMNLDGDGFANIGFLMDCSFEFDSRAALAGDLDADGRMDLLVEHRDIRKNERNLYFLRNQSEDRNQWVGVWLLPGVDAATSPLGAKVVVRLDDGRTLVQHCIAGHSVWAQHEDRLHFGLGKAGIRGIEVHWPGGQRTDLKTPQAGQYYKLVAPRKS